MESPLKLGVIGSTLSYSKSPQIQNAGLEFLKISGNYQALEVIPEDFNDEIVPLLKTLNGANITIPYKESVLKFLNKKDKLVERIGATNTLVINSMGIQGYNTDYYGFMESLKQHDLANAQVSLIGAGGASKAVIVALEDMGVDEINVYVRNPGKAEDGLPNIKNSKLNLKLYTKEEDLSASDLLINTTPIGQGRLAGTMPITEGQLASLSEEAIVYDLIYSKTKLLEEAEKRKLKIYDGSQMLILQAAKSLSIWSGLELSDDLIKVMTEAYSS